MPTQGRGSRPSSGISDRQRYECESETQSSHPGDNEHSLERARLNKLRVASIGQPPPDEEQHHSSFTSEAEFSESSAVSSENEEAPIQPQQSRSARNATGNDELAQRHTHVGLQRESNGLRLSDSPVLGTSNQSTRPLDTIPAVGGTNKLVSLSRAVYCVLACLRRLPMRVMDALTWHTFSGQ